MKLITRLMSVVLIFLLSFSSSFAQNFFEQATGGECKTASCYSKYNFRKATNGECETASCYSKKQFKQATNGECDTASCFTKFKFKQASGGVCETASCYCALYPCGGGGGYNYDVQGFGGGQYVTGNIDASGDRYVDGYLTLDDGTEVYFDGEWTGNGEIDGYDENGNYYELEVD